MPTVIFFEVQSSCSGPPNRITGGEVCHSTDVLNQERRVSGRNRVPLDDLALHFRCAWRVPSANSRLNHSKYL